MQDPAEVLSSLLPVILSHVEVVIFGAAPGLVDHGGVDLDLASLDEDLENPWLGGTESTPQGSAFLVVFLVHINVGVPQQLGDDREVSLMGGPVQGGLPFTCGEVNVDILKGEEVLDNV